MTGYNMRYTFTFDRISKKWREKADKTKEYEIYENKETDRDFELPFLSGVEYKEYLQAQKYKQRLLKTYNKKILEDVINGEEIQTKKGTCYYIKNHEKINFSAINANIAKDKILTNFKLIYGIGEVTEQALKKQGYKTIEDLIKHPRFGFEAKKLVECVGECDTSKIADWIRRWFSISHPLLLYSSAFHNKEDFIFLDLETLGLSANPIILIGAAQIAGHNIITHQYLVRSIKEEPAVLSGFLSHLNNESAFITYNGKTFDLPFLEGRLVYYRMKADLQKPHFDLLHFSRRAWKDRLPNCKLTTLEKHILDIKRENDVPGALVPGFYQTYLETKNVGPLIPIIEHNRQDLITLANIFSKLFEELE